MRTERLLWDEKRLHALEKIAAAAEAHGTRKKLDWIQALSVCRKEAKILDIEPGQLSKAWSKQKRFVEGTCISCGKRDAVKGKKACPACLKRAKETSKKYVRELRKAGFVRQGNKYVKK
jgi:hypothetical protein